METFIALYRDHPAYFITVTGILGVLIGSFLNVVAIRLPKGQSVVRPPSRCPECLHRLGPLDLVPVVSYFLLGGKCRYCKAAFSPMYAVGEAVTGTLYAVLAWRLGFSEELAVGLLFVSILVVIVLTDIREMIIPDKVVFFGMTAAFMLRLFIHPLPLWNYLSAFFIGGGMLYALAAASLFFLKKEGVGGGDIKLFALIGLIVGVKLTVLSLFLASMLGLLYGLLKMAFGAFSKDQYLPFGPFIAAGSVLSYLWGETMLNGYVRFIFQ